MSAPVGHWTAYDWISFGIGLFFLAVLIGAVGWYLGAMLVEAGW